MELDDGHGTTWERYAKGTLVSQPLYIGSFVHLKSLKKKKVLRKTIKRAKPEPLRKGAARFS